MASSCYHLPPAFSDSIVRVSVLTSRSHSPCSHLPRDTPLRILFSASPELKSHKERVSFLAAVSFEAHLSPLISILMVYSCRPADDPTVCENVCAPVSLRVAVCPYVGVCRSTSATRAHLEPWLYASDQHSRRHCALDHLQPCPDAKAFSFPGLIKKGPIFTRFNA